jgi:SAM-dependent methyltransferase
MIPTTSNLEAELDEQIRRVKIAAKDGLLRDSEDFNVRGGLYRLAFLFAPNARNQDIENIKKWVNPLKGEKSIDIAAGTGFLTKHIATWTEAIVYAIDPSSVQLSNLENNCEGLPVKTITGSLSELSTLEKLGDELGKIDFVTSFGGIHHVIDKGGVNCQKKMFEYISKALKPGGRFIAADVGVGTSLAKHFETSVKKHCLTGHEEKWLSLERLQNELIEGTGLKYIKSEMVPIQWLFETKHQMAMFMKCLHAYDLTEEEVIGDLSSILGFEEKDGKVYLNWPMLFFHLEKKF